MMNHDKKIESLQLILPPAAKPMGAYRPMVQCQSLAYLSGHGPLMPDGQLIVGRVGESLDLDAGRTAARQTGLAILATLRHELGTLDRIRRVVKVFGMVNCVPTFVDQPAVINGCSELFRDVFGEAMGIAARSAVGVAALPGGMAVEIEAIIELHDAA